MILDTCNKTAININIIIESWQIIILVSDKYVKNTIKIEIKIKSTLNW